ncbi:MAG: InlB B-repeat-containing protein, partial [Propionibacteriaceae bacterium]|nr:InlB B-repeat-containing protein [Propionibacteriaceae bacterium]
LYAHWAGEKRKIKFYANGGKSLKPKTKTVVYGSKYGSLAKVKRSGYKFTGWYTKKKGGKRVKAAAIVKSTKTLKLYAHWKKK